MTDRTRHLLLRLVIIGCVILVIGFFVNLAKRGVEMDRTSSGIEYGDEGTLGRGPWDESVAKVPVGQSPDDFVEALKRIDAKDLVSLSQMMDGGRVKMYPVGSRIRVTSIRGSACEVEFMDGWRGWISDRMFNP